MRIHGILEEKQFFRQKVPKEGPRSLRKVIKETLWAVDRYSKNPFRMLIYSDPYLGKLDSVKRHIDEIYEDLTGREGLKVDREGEPIQRILRTKKGAEPIFGVVFEIRIENGSKRLLRFWRKGDGENGRNAP